MNSLLKRQIRKYLDPSLQSNKELETFLDAVNRSYNTSDEQFIMLQRATSISSDELFKANQQLKKESDSQKEIIEKLKNLLDTLKFYDLKDDENVEKLQMDSSELVDFIDSQAKKIIKINQQRDKILENLERQNQELRDYTHIVSHDLKSPLQSIDALATWIKEDYNDVIDEGGKEKIDLIRENVEKMDTLVKGILQYSTIDKVEKERYDIDVNFLVNQVINSTTIPKQIEVIIDNKLPIIKGDLFRLEQLFLNLIINAVKFNNKEKGVIKIGCLEKENHWQFYVKDNGKGIEEKYFNKIFIAFQKLEDDYKSSGIGLSIVKKIIDVYQGEIWVESELNTETTFYFTLKK